MLRALWTFITLLTFAACAADREGQMLQPLLVQRAEAEAESYQLYVRMDARSLYGEEIKFFAAAKGPAEQEFKDRRKVLVSEPGEPVGGGHIGPFDKPMLVVLHIPYALLRRAETDLRVELLSLSDPAKKLTQVIELGPLPPVNLPLPPE